jgi:hypothetical protein
VGAVGDRARGVEVRGEVGRSAGEVVRSRVLVTFVAGAVKMATEPEIVAPLRAAGLERSAAFETCNVYPLDVDVTIRVALIVVGVKPGALSVIVPT